MPTRRVTSGVVVEILLTCALLFVCARVDAAPPRLNLFGGGGQKVEADPNVEYKLADTNGPWLVQVTSFSGPNARQEANNLVFELRSKYRYKAYVYDKVFVNDLAREEKKPKGLYGHKKYRYQKTGQRQEFIVLIGDFQSMDDRDFQATLKAVKTIKPDIFKATSQRSSMSYAEWRGNISSTGNERGPFYMAMGTRNPMTPPENQPGTIDKFLASLNAQRPYSLLSCPGRYTVRVATFTGRIVIRQEEIKEIEAGKRPFSERKVSELELSEKAAVQLCKILRQQGYEAYEFHDYHASYVTVGSFQSVGQELPNGMIERNPGIHAIIEKFKGRPSTAATAQTISFEPVRFGEIECDVQPLIIPVPKVRL